MEMSSDDFIEGATKGAVKGALEFSEDKIKLFLRKFKDRELAFIEDEQTIKLVKTQREKPEWALYRKYVKDGDLRLQIEMGFSLRQLEKIGEKNKHQNLRNKLHKKYGEKGLHIAEIVQ